MRHRANRRRPIGLLEHEHRDQPIGLLLVLRVRRVGGDRPLPPRRALVAGHLARGELERVRSVLDHDLRVGPEVVHPDRVLGSAAHRPDRHVVALMLDPHQRGLTHRAGLGAPVGDDHHRQPGLAQRRPGGAAGTLVLGYLIPNPSPRARHVLTVDSHAHIQHPDRPRSSARASQRGRKSAGGIDRRGQTSALAGQTLAAFLGLSALELLAFFDFLAGAADAFGAAAVDAFGADATAALAAVGAAGFDADALDAAGFAVLADLALVVVEVLVAAVADSPLAASLSDATAV